MRPRRSAALLLVALGAAPDVPGFAPEEGLELVKEFRVAVDVEVDDLTLVVDGETLQGFLDHWELAFSSLIETRVRDRYDEVDAGRPTHLTRTFERIASTLTLSEAKYRGDGDTESLESELEGRVVEFRLDAGTDEYDVAFADVADGASGPRNRELLAGLVEDMDLRVLLPTGDVAVGESWDVPVAQAVRLLAPGGDLRLGSEEVDGDVLAILERLFAGDLGEAAGHELEGRVECTLAECDAELALVELELDVAWKGELTDWLDDLFDGGISFPQAEVAVVVRGKGRLDWDVAGGHARSLELAAELEVESTVRMLSASSESRIDATLGGELTLGMETR